MNNNQNEKIERKVVLSKEFNEFWQSVFSGNLSNYDFYNQLTVSQFIKLKNVLSNINNIITMKLTELFIDELDLISEDEKTEAKRIVQELSANENGYDLVYTTKKNIKIIAEVKGINPCDKIKLGKIYGSKQQENIIDDLIGLIDKNNKQKSGVDDDKFTSAIKFMVVLDDEDKQVKKISMPHLKKGIDRHELKYDQDLKNLPEARNNIKKLLKNNNINDIVIDYDDNKDKGNLNPRVIYVFYIKLDESNFKALE